MNQYTESTLGKSCIATEFCGIFFTLERLGIPLDLMGSLGISILKVYTLGKSRMQIQARITHSHSVDTTTYL